MIKYGNKTLCKNKKQGILLMLVSLIIIILGIIFLLLSGTTIFLILGILSPVISAIFFTEGYCLYKDDESW